LTWAKLDDGFPAHRKVRGLSDAAFRLHVTALCDCAAHLTDGAITAPAARTLPGAPQGRRLTRAINELVEAGLWDVAGDGWRLHDYLDWNPAAAPTLERRAQRAAAGRVGGQRSGEVRRARQLASAEATQARSKREATCFEETEANGKQVLHRTGSKREAKTNPVPVPVPVQDPDLIAAAEDLSGGVPPNRLPEQPPPPEVLGKIPCPAGLRLTDDQRATLETAMVPDWAIDALTPEVVAGFQGDPDDHRPLSAWRKCLARAVGGRWNDPRRRRELLDARGATAPEARPPTPWRPPPGEGEGAVPCPPELARRLRGAGYGGPLAPTGSGSQ